MDEKRLKKASDKFNAYLEEGKIKKISEINPLIFETYLRNARESLNVANQLFNNKSSYLWVIVTSYYSMFYMACAYLYSLGYKAGHEIIHQVVSESLIIQGRDKIKNHFLENYNEERDKALVIADIHLDNYEMEKMKRASFQYETTEFIKESKARTSLNRAKEFLTLMEEILV